MGLQENVDLYSQIYLSEDGTAILFKMLLKSYKYRILGIYVGNTKTQTVFCYRKTHFLLWEIVPIALLPTPNSKLEIIPVKSGTKIIKIQNIIWYRLWVFTKHGPD